MPTCYILAFACIYLEESPLVGLLHKCVWAACFRQVVQLKNAASLKMKLYLSSVQIILSGMVLSVSFLPISLFILIDTKNCQSPFNVSFSSALRVDLCLFFAFFVRMTKAWISDQPKCHAPPKGQILKQQEREIESTMHALPFRCCHYIYCQVLIKTRLPAALQFKVSLLALVYLAWGFI